MSVGFLGLRVDTAFAGLGLRKEAFGRILPCKCTRSKTSISLYLTGILQQKGSGVFAVSKLQLEP